MDCKVYENVEIRNISQIRKDPDIQEGETYFYLDLMWDVSSREFRNDIVDHQNLTMSMIFKNPDQIFDYRKFWNYIQDHMCAFKEGSGNACFILDPDGNIGIATTKNNYPEFTYFESIEAAQEILEAVGPERIKAYMF